MKTAEQLLKEKGIRPKTIHHNYDYVYRAVYDIIEQVKKEAYNQALEDVVKSIKLKLYSLSPYDDTSDGYDLKETSIPPLYTRGFNGFINGKLEIDKDSILKLKK